MKILEHKNIKVKDLVEGYINDLETGSVEAFGGKLNVRPPYQREFVWDQGSSNGGKKQKALIDSIIKGYPINVMYWVKVDKNQAGEDLYECLDGQQRIITMCKFKNNEFGMEDGTQFDGLIDNTKFLDYNMFTIYICEADTLEEKLSWFERINTAGEPLSKQEMRSAIACGVGTTQAKKYFVDTKAKNGTNAHSFDIQFGKAGRDYIDGKWDRQGVYEKIITWKINSKKDEEILAYMKNHRNDLSEAEALFEYFKNVIRWVKRLFPTYNNDMKKVDWGFLYNKFHLNNKMSSEILESEINYLRSDIGKDNNSHLESSKGIYEYVLEKVNGNDKPQLLNRRTFTEKEKQKQYDKQKGVCPHCKKRYNFKEMVGDHIIPYKPIPETGQINGTTTADNLQMLCHSCNLEKSNKPFNKELEEKRLKTIYLLTDEEISALEYGIK